LEFHGEKAHPHRRHRYTLEASVKLLEPYEKWSNIDYLYLDWLRQMSNISSAFRKGLRDAFLERTALIVDEHAELEFLSFLKERLAILSGIKILSFRLECLRGPFLESNIQNFVTACDFISTHLAVEDFLLNITVGVDNLQDLVESWGILKELTAVWNLKITKEFEVSLSIVGTDNKLDESVRNQGENSELLLKRSMMPNTLRLQPPTKEEKYLASRLSSAM
jgi:hypothetical protein